MITGNFATVTDLYNHVTDQLVWHPESLDCVRPPSVISYGNLLTADSCEFDVDLRSIGLTKIRWSRFLGQYVSRTKLKKWFELVPHQRLGIVNLYQTDGATGVRPDHYRQEEEGHRWGTCFLGFSLIRLPKPTLTLYSRTARLPTTATMELGLISHVARELSEKYSVPQPIRFVWYATSLHVTAHDLMMHLHYRGELEKMCGQDTVLGKCVRRTLTKIDATPVVNKETVKYGRLRRTTTRVKDMQVGHLLPECWVSKLSMWTGSKE